MSDLVRILLWVALAVGSVAIVFVIATLIAWKIDDLIDKVMEDE